MGRDTLPDGWMDGWMDSLEHTIPAGIPSCRGSCRPGTQTRMVRRSPHVCAMWSEHRFAHGWLPRGLVGWMDGWMDGWTDGWTDGDLFVSCIYHLSIHIERVYNIELLLPLPKMFFWDNFIYLFIAFFFNDHKKLGNFWN